MKKLLLLLLTITTFSFSFSSKIVFETTPGSSKIHLPFKYEDNHQCDRMIERKAYVSCYSFKNKIPLFVAYRLTKESVSPSMKRPSRFFYDNTIPSEYRSKNSHYKRSGYDKGHMMENASADYNKQAQLETFILSNIVPQNSKLNRNAWAYLEKATRIAAKRYGLIYVITGAIPSKDNFLKKGHVNIPAYMYKIIVIPSKDKVNVILVPNDSSVDKKEILTSKYKSSINEIENLSGIKFDIDKRNDKVVKEEKTLDQEEKHFTSDYYEKIKAKASDIDYKGLYYKLKKVF